MVKKLIFGLIVTFLFLGIRQAQAGLRDGLMLHYSFDTDYGVTVPDDSGNGHDGSVIGAVYTSDGRFNGAYSFDGVDDYILAGNLGYHETGTISFWMNAEAVENWRNPFSTDYASWDDNIRFEENSKGDFSGGGHGLGRGDLFTRAMEPHRWYHVAYAWDQAYVYGYLDGDLKFKNPHPDPASKVHPDLPLTAGEYKANTLNFTNVAIGNGYSAAPDRYWKGLIDEVRMYDRPLSAAEVRMLAQGRADGLVLHYTFDTDNGSTVIDQSGLGNNGTVSGATFTPTGRIGGAYQFDGVDDQIAVWQSPSLNLGDELTLAAWFYVTDTDERPIIEWSSDINSGVHMWTNAKGFQWYGKGTGANLVDTTGDEFAYVINTDDPPINQWHHLTVCYSKSTGKAQLYLDGVPVVEKTLGAFTPLTSLPLYIGRRPTGSGKSFRGLLDDVRIYNKALGPLEVRAMFDALTHGKIYQNFEPNNGTGTEYGWPINGVTVTRTTEQKHGASYSWQVSIPSATLEWWGGTGIKSQVEPWHLDAQPQRHDRLTFWILAYPQPTTNIAQAVRVKFFDHNNYFTDGFMTQTEQQFSAGVWTKLHILFTQLPADFNLYDIDKIEIFQQVPGTYYIDDIEITSADRIHQAFEKRPAALTADKEEYGWPWSEQTGTVSLSTQDTAEGLQSWNLTATNTPPSMSGTFIKYQGKWFGDDGFPYDLWNINMSPATFDPRLYGQLTFFFKQLGENKLANNLELGFFDHADYNASAYKSWSTQRSDYGEWARITIPFKDFPDDFNLNDVDKIEMGVWWPGPNYFDDIRVTKYPELRINENLLPDGLVTWPEHPGAVRYVLQRSTTSAQGPWATVYTGGQTLYQTTRLTPSWFRLHWESDANTSRGTVAYISDWSQAVRYEPRPVLITKDNLQQGYVEWLFIPQASLYEIQEGSTKFGSWTLIYRGTYQVPPPVPAVVGKWYRARAIQKNNSGKIIARGPYSPALLCDPQAFVTAEGVAIREKRDTGKFLKLCGVNLGNYFLIEPWMLFGNSHPFTAAYPDDWSIRDTLQNRPDMGLAGLAAVLNQYRQAYIQESDLDNLMRMGVNFIRLPLYVQDIRPLDDSGEWLAEQFDFSAIDRLVRLCGDRGIYVLLDLHGAPGYQSKEFHTGRLDFNRLFTPGDDIFRQRTVEFWAALAGHYKDNNTVLGYDLLNEPFGAITPEYYPNPADGYAALWSLYDRIYDAIRNAVSEGGAGDANHLIVMDSIPSDHDWETLPNPSAYGWGNVMYQHHYYGFGRSYDEHILYLNDKIQNSRQIEYQVPVMIGEFNGFGEARTWELLMDTFNAQGWGWGMWSYKIHDATSEWGLYTHTYYDESVPDPANDTLPILMRKLSKYATAQYHKPHKSLINIVRTRAQLPGYIHDLKATKGRRQVVLNWSAPYSVSSITRYVVRYGTVASGTFNLVFNDNAVPGATIKGLTRGVAYQFRVEAVNKEGTGPLSNVATATPNS